MIWWLIPGWLKRAVAWAVAGLLAAAGIFYAGRINDRKNAKIEGLKGYRETRERMDNAPHASDADDAHKRLSERDPKQR